ncbi:DUF6420 family protein [Streptomyces sp. NPDC058620]|uniref:DUF6420 family protein n=1 Tax=Streptomyces sp. NPDC058620 TaxID=3346560 RepID=UPI00364F823E
MTTEDRGAAGPCAAYDGLPVLHSTETALPLLRRTDGRRLGCHVAPGHAAAAASGVQGGDRELAAAGSFLRCARVASRFRRTTGCRITFLPGRRDTPTTRAVSARRERSAAHSRSGYLLLRTSCSRGTSAPRFPQVSA